MGMIEHEEIPQRKMTPQEKPDKGGDFETWLAMDEERTHLNTQAQLADLMDSLKKNLSNRDGELLKNKLSPKTQTSSLPKKSVSFSDTIQTRQIGDEKKNALQGIAESIYVPFRALKDGIIDA
jgi:hypothetical protein